MSGHTPGPWRTAILVGGYIHAKPTAAHAAKYPKNKWVQVGHVCTFAECSREESEANLRLMAAAPDLLAALQSCADQIAIFAATGRRVPIDAPCLDAALAAISKATGVSHA
jgi:hypothetical protein